jgi:hypothetical protein
LLSVPVGALTIAVFMCIFPNRLSKEPRNNHGKLSVRFLRKIDFLGCTLLLGTCLLLTTGLQQAALGYGFDSPFVLPLLVCSGPFFIAFLISQWFITTRRTTPEPVFPWRFCESRVRSALIMYDASSISYQIKKISLQMNSITLLNGGVLSTCVVQIPQRYMTVNGMTPFSAAARLLPFGAFVIFGTIVAVPTMNILRVYPPLIMAIGSALEVIGTALLSRASSDYDVKVSQYGFQILVGTGVGFIVSAVMFLIPTAVEQRDYGMLL